MGTIYGKVVLLTGASSGIGKSTAKLLMEKGFRVYGTSRKAGQPGSGNPAPEQQDGGSKGFIEMIKLDVCSEESVKKAVDYVLDKEGRIDILINNAGFGIAGSVEDTSPEEAYSQFNTNFFGVHRMCRHVIPVMRKQGKGLIINVGSICGIMAIPYQSMYSASKFALEALSEALRTEVKPFGIKVTIIEPGDTRTGFTDSRQIVAGARGDSPYKENFTKSVNGMAQAERSGTDPIVAAKVIARIINMKNPPVRKSVGFFYKAVVFLKRFLPSRFVAYAIEKFY